MLNSYSSLFSKNPSFLAGASGFVIDSITVTDSDQMTFCNSFSIDRSIIIQSEEKINGSESTKAVSL